VIGEKDVLGFVAPRPVERRNGSEPALQALYQAATKLADIRRGGPKFKTRDLVGLLLSHGARSWRNSLPVAEVRLRVVAPTGKPAVRLKLGG
jgi:hypothetical protein